MAQSDARFGYTAKLSRSDHDLGRPFGFTCAPGMLLPIHADLVSPGDSLYIQHDLPFMRTNPLAAPAMVDVKVHFDSFFVPLQLIYQPSENTLTSITENYSSMFDPNNMRNNAFPLLNYSGYITKIKTDYYRSDLHAEAFRLADMLGLHPELFLNWTSQARKPWLDFDDGVPTAFFPWQILSYHAIFEYFYRLDDKSGFSSVFNWDQYYSIAQPVNAPDTFMQIHSRPWDFDYFTSIYYSPIVSNANLQSVLADGTYSDLMPTFKTTPVSSTGLVSNINFHDSAFSSGIPALSAEGLRGSFDTAMIRQMFANEKLAMITGRTRKNYDSQILAHYGVKVPHDVKHELSLIGHDEYSLRVGEVTSLASTDDAPLGELAGKGWASSRENGKEPRTHKFVAPVHGVVMTIFSVEPIRRYYGGFERQNMIHDAFDLPVPEFDRLGNQPMFRYEVGQGSVVSDSAIDIIGWKERYYSFKRRSPKVTFAFQQTLRGQGANNYESYMLGFRPFSEHRSFNATSGTNTYNFSNPFDSGRFYIPFNAMDNVMLTSYGYGFCAGKDGQSYTDEDWNSNPHLLYSRDPFIVDCYPRVKKVSWMSKDGEPIYPY